MRLIGEGIRLIIYYLVCLQACGMNWIIADVKLSISFMIIIKVPR